MSHVEESEPLSYEGEGVLWVHHLGLDHLKQLIYLGVHRLKSLSTLGLLLIH